MVKPITTAAVLALAMMSASGRSEPADYIARCANEVQGTKIWFSSTIRVHRKDLSAKLNEIDIPTYCQCYHRTLRNKLGNDLYVRSQSLNGQLTPAELEMWGEQNRQSVIACVEAQLVGRQSSASTSDEEKYVRFIRSTVTPGNGVGGLRVGDSRTTVFRILGPTKTFRRMPDGGEDYYYGPNATEVVISLSPAPARTIRQITLNYRFQGQISGGGRIRDPREKIKRVYPGKLAVDVRDYLVYCDGTTFLFSGGRLDSIRLSDLASDVWERERRRHCSER